MQTLTVVNDMLATLGELPLNSLSDPHAFKAAALSALDTHNKNIQSRGWWFNRDVTTLPLTTSNTIVLPGDTLMYRSDTPGRIKRGNYLYDQFNSTDVFTSEDTGVIVRLIPFESLDELAAMYIASTATMWFCTNYDADRAKVEILARNVAELNAVLNSEEIRQVGANLLLNNPRLARIKSAFTARRFS